MLASSANFLHRLYKASKNKEQQKIATKATQGIKRWNCKDEQDNDSLKLNYYGFKWTSGHEGKHCDKIDKSLDYQFKYLKALVYIILSSSNDCLEKKKVFCKRRKKSIYRAKICWFILISFPQTWATMQMTNSIGKKREKRSCNLRRMSPK